MSPKRKSLFVAIAFTLLCTLDVSSYGESGNSPQDSAKLASIEEVIAAGNKAIRDGDWTNAESRFREAIRLEPKQGLWRIQFTLILGHQKKWKHVSLEIDKLAKLNAIDWIIALNEKLSDGKVAFVHTNIFRDENLGILRYLKAVREKKKVDSVSEDIGDKLEKFAKKRGIALVYDMDRLESERFEAGNAIDLTGEFIAYYNALYKD